VRNPSNPKKNDPAQQSVPFAPSALVLPEYSSRLRRIHRHQTASLTADTFPPALCTRSQSRKSSAKQIRQRLVAVQSSPSHVWCRHRSAHAKVTLPGRFAPSAPEKKFAWRLPRFHFRQKEVLLRDAAVFRNKSLRRLRDPANTPQTHFSGNTGHTHIPVALHEISCLASCRQQIRYSTF